MTQSTHTTTTAPVIHHHHRRTQSSNASKARPARPTLSRRSTTTYSIHKLGSGQPRPGSSKDAGDDDFDMASFLNFCAMCERQITVPDNSLLYCSEHCRRKDSCKPLAASCPSTTTPIMTTTTTTTTTTPPTSPPMSPRTIVPPLTPTRLPSTKASHPIRIPGYGHDHDHDHDHDHSYDHSYDPDHQTDLDPSEWKPVICSAPGRFSTLASSDAWLYLSQFHDEPMLPTSRRPGSSSKRGSTSTASLSAFSAPGTLPALVNTPSTMASSFSSTASDASVSASASASGFAAAAAMTAAGQNRPLPPRHKGTSKSVELVVPHVNVNAPVVDVTAPESDRGSIFPASSSLWG